MNNSYNDFQPQEEYTPKPVDLKSAKKTYSKIGIALCIIIVAVFITQTIMVTAIELSGEKAQQFMESSTGMWILSFVPLYAVAIPLGLFFMKGLPSNPPQKKNMGTKFFWTALPISIFLVYIGNYIGNFLSIWLSKGTAENSLDSFAMDASPLKILVMVILAPMIEEIVFRKIIIDKTRVYGEKTAVLFSGLLFGLFHMNLFQFFYAFFVGIVLGYVYMHTGKLRYTVIIHSIINFFGSVIAPFVVSKLDINLLNEMSNLDPTAEITEEMVNNLISALPGMLMFLGYSFLWGGLALAGFILFIKNHKKISYNPAELQLPADSVANTVYMNAGIIIYIILTVSFTVMSIFG